MRAAGRLRCGGCAVPRVEGMPWRRRPWRARGCLGRNLSWRRRPPPWRRRRRPWPPRPATLPAAVLAALAGLGGRLGGRLGGLRRCAWRLVFALALASRAGGLAALAAGAALATGFAGGFFAGAFFAGGLGRGLRRLGRGLARPWPPAWLSPRVSWSWQRPWAEPSLPVSSHRRRRRRAGGDPPNLPFVVAACAVMTAIYTLIVRTLHGRGPPFHAARAAPPCAGRSPISCGSETNMGRGRCAWLIEGASLTRPRGMRPRTRPHRRVRQGTAPGPAGRCPAAGRSR